MRSSSLRLNIKKNLSIASVLYPDVEIYCRVSNQNGLTLIFVSTFLAQLQGVLFTFVVLHVFSSPLTVKGGLCDLVHCIHWQLAEEWLRPMNAGISEHACVVFSRKLQDCKAYSCWSLRFTTRFITLKLITVEEDCHGLILYLIFLKSENKREKSSHT